MFKGNYYVNITEGKISGPVISVTAIDLDENPKITYRITKNYLTDTFSIDSETGEYTNYIDRILINYKKINNYKDKIMTKI